jgi:predicted CXXCH cytochrome family protein
VHVFDELPDGKRLDPFVAESYTQEFAMYAESCSVCHTTFPLGDLLTKDVKQMSREVPVRLHWSASNYLQEQRPDWLCETEIGSDEALHQFLSQLKRTDAPTHAVTLGISCEACHLGAREHVNDPKKLPQFFPHSAHLRVEGQAKDIDFGRTHDNLNWTCGRCHSGSRPQFAGGMSTWNSTEYSDAMRGSCYSELRCIDCHNPHQSTGHKWSRTPAEDDALCIRCHQQYETPEAQASHSHHPAGSSGSRCMNCHMPRINEGMQDLVRTHTIFSPTEPRMLHGNQPNACNQCHTDKAIDWTLGYLQQWYDKTYDPQRLAQAYPEREQPAAVGWLHSDNEAVRLVAADSLVRTESRWALGELLDALDDRFLVNRQFARKGLEKMLGVRLDDYGYRFYMTPEERSEPIASLRAALLSASSPAGQALDRETPPASGEN